MIYLPWRTLPPESSATSQYRDIPWMDRFGKHHMEPTLEPPVMALHIDVTVHEEEAWIEQEPWEQSTGGEELVRVDATHSTLPTGLILGH